MGKVSKIVKVPKGKFILELNVQEENLVTI